MPTALTLAAPAAPLIEGLLTASKLGEQGAPMLDVALALLAGGWRVFPCGDNKAPLIPGGFKSRDGNAEKGRPWWTTPRNAMPAVCPGHGGPPALGVDSAA